MVFVGDGDGDVDDCSGEKGLEFGDFSFRLSTTSTSVNDSISMFKHLTYYD